MRPESWDKCTILSHILNFKVAENSRITIMWYVLFQTTRSIFCEDFAMLFWCRRNTVFLPQESIAVNFNYFQCTWMLFKGSWTSQLSLNNRFTSNPAVLTEPSVITRVSKMSNQGGVKLLLSSGLRYSLPQQELVDGLLLPHALHNQPVQINKQSATETTGDPAGHTKTRSVSAASWEGMKLATLNEIHTAGEKNSCFSWASLWKAEWHKWILFPLIKPVGIKQINFQQTRQSGHSLCYWTSECAVNFMAAPLNTNQPSAVWECDLEGRLRLNETSNLLGESEAELIQDQFKVAPVQPEKTHPRMANAGSSWRSNGKSRRKRVLKRAVMVSEEWKERRLHCQIIFCCSSWSKRSQWRQIQLLNNDKLRERMNVKWMWDRQRDRQRSAMRKQGLLPSSWFHTANTLKMKALKVAAKKPLQ